MESQLIFPSYRKYYFVMELIKLWLCFVREQSRIEWLKWDRAAPFQISGMRWLHSLCLVGGTRIALVLSISITWDPSISSPFLFLPFSSPWFLPAQRCSRAARPLAHAEPPLDSPHKAKNCREQRSSRRKRQRWNGASTFGRFRWARSSWILSEYSPFPGSRTKQRTEPLHPHQLSNQTQPKFS